MNNLFRIVKLSGFVFRVEIIYGFLAFAVVCCILYLRRKGLNT